MNFNLSQLSKVSVDSLVQQGLDSFFSRQSKSGLKEKEKIRTIKCSLDRKGELYRLPPTHEFTLCAYQVRRQDAVGSILITLDNLRNFHKALHQEILDAAAKGNLKKADKYIHQKRNVDIANYTHRIKGYRITKNKAKILVWIIDLDLHKETSDQKSYGSGTAKAVVLDLATAFLDHPKAKASRLDYLDVVIDLDWIEEIRNVARPFYNHSHLHHKIIYHQSLSGEHRLVS